MPKPITIDEAGVILDDIAKALEKHDPKPLRSRPYRELCDALKLMIAVEAREHARTNPSEFKKGVQTYSSPMWNIAHLPGYSIVKPGTMDLREDVATMETGESFGDFCAKALKGDFTEYWKAVYARLEMPWHDGLPYRDTPPRPEAPRLWKRLFG